MVWKMCVWIQREESQCAGWKEACEFALQCPELTVEAGFFFLLCSESSMDRLSKWNPSLDSSQQTGGYQQEDLPALLLEF